jgi:hypothetical protein
MTSVRKRKRRQQRGLQQMIEASERLGLYEAEGAAVRVRFARDFPTPTPEQSARLRQDLRDAGDYSRTDSALGRNFAREVGSDDALLAKVRERLQRGERPEDIDLDDL